MAATRSTAVIGCGASTSIHIGPLAATLRACADSALNDQETRYLAALQLAARYRVTGSRLTLYRPGGTIAATFQRATGLTSGTSARWSERDLDRAGAVLGGEHRERVAPLLVERERVGQHAVEVTRPERARSR